MNFSLIPYKQRRANTNNHGIPSAPVMLRFVRKVINLGEGQKYNNILSPFRCVVLSISEDDKLYLRVKEARGVRKWIRFFAHQVLAKPKGREKKAFCLHNEVLRLSHFMQKVVPFGKPKFLSFNNGPLSLNGRPASRQAGATFFNFLQSQQRCPCPRSKWRKLKFDALKMCDLFPVLVMDPPQECCLWRLQFSVAVTFDVFKKLGSTESFFVGLARVGN